MREVLLDEVIAGRRHEVVLAAREGKLTLSIGVHRESDGKGVWANIDARDLPRVIPALERAYELSMGDGG